MPLAQVRFAGRVDSGPTDSPTRLHPWDYILTQVHCFSRSLRLVCLGCCWSTAKARTGYKIFSFTRRRGLHTTLRAPLLQKGGWGACDPAGEQLSPVIWRGSPPETDCPPPMPSDCPPKKRGLPVTCSAAAQESPAEAGRAQPGCVPPWEAGVRNPHPPTVRI